MYSAMLPVTGAGMTVGGVLFTVFDLVWAGIAFAVIGGTLITVSKFAPRVAFEPVPTGIGSSRWRLTVNGRPVRHDR